MDRLKALLSTPLTGPRVLLGCTGSVATIKVPLLARALQNRGITVIIVPTQPSLHFLINANINDSNSINKTEEKLECRCPGYNKTTSSVSGVKTNSCEWCLVMKLYPDLNFASDALEWEAWQGRGDPVLHIELRKWAELMVIAPLSANSLAKLAGGLCDNLLTCTARAWDTKKPLLFCPAMNTLMYEHPLTAIHIASLKVGILQF